jgi:Na+-driven multidrug efflux pump
MLIELLWAIGQGVYKLSLGRMGVSELASYTILETILNLFSAISIGFGNASGLVLGQTIGQKNYVKAYQQASLFIKLNFILVIPIGLFLIVMSPVLQLWFQLSAKTSYYLTLGLIIYGFSLSLKSYNFLMTTGILRSGGDSKFVSIVSDLNW